MATSDTRSLAREDTLKGDEKIVAEAMRRFDVCANYESDARLRFIEDIKFCNGDADNMWQWDENTRNARGYGQVDERPCLTINKVRQHCLNIINDAKQNKPSVKVKPVGNGATYESSQIFEGVCRHIEYISNAQAAYDRATTFQVQGGIGWIRLVTDYPDDHRSFNDQEIYIRGVKDPLTVFLDPDIREPDGSDARFGFVFDDMSREVYEDTYPKYKDLANKSPLDVSGDWLREDQVRVCEYYRTVETEDTLLAIQGPSGPIVTRKSKLKDEEYRLAIDDPQTKKRQIVDKKIEWYLIAGDKIIERSIWPGRYIPLIRVIGEETVINGKMDRKGHTRAMKDPQRLANYWYSAATEHVALQSKTPYIGAMESFSNLETYWDSANTVNHAWLPYNAYDDKGQKLEAPQRQAPPVMAEAYIKGLEIASQEIREVSGQFQADLGMPSNEKSGVAIQQRQRQGDVATYHFIDNLALAIRNMGKQLIDLIPKIYDTKRIIKIMAEDGVEHEVLIDPNAAQALQKKQQESQFDIVQAIFNPNVGKYDVEADIGPAYATRRQEEFDALIKLMDKNEKLAQVAGDLLFKAADFPGAEEVARRIRATIPQNILNGQPGPSPQDADMQKQMAAQSDMIGKLSQELSKLKVDRDIEEQQKDIDRYKAITDRLNVIKDFVTTDAEKMQMAHDMMMAEHQSNQDMLKSTHEAMLGVLAARAAPQDPQMAAGTAQPQPPQTSSQPQPDMRTVLLVRHGSTSMNNNDASVDRIRGWKDIPLSPEGHQEAEKLANKLSSNPPDAIYSSDLKRAHDTAQIISRKTGVPVQSTSQYFRPWNVGKYAGQKSSEAVPILAEFVVKAPDQPVPDGESFNAFRGRFFAGLAAVLRANPGRTAIVSHHRDERLLLGWAAAGFRPDGAIDMKVFNQKGEPPGQVTEVDVPMDNLMQAAAHLNQGTAEAA